MLRLYDSAIENCKEILDLPDISSDHLTKEAYELKVAYYLAFRLVFFYSYHYLFIFLSRFSLFHCLHSL